MSDTPIKPLSAASVSQGGGPIARRITPSRSIYKQLSGLLGQPTAWPVRLPALPVCKRCGSFLFPDLRTQIKGLGGSVPSCNAAIELAAAKRPGGMPSRAASYSTSLKMETVLRCATVS